MNHFGGHNLRHMMDDYYDIAQLGENNASDHSEAETFSDSRKMKSDTSASEARSGKDIQGIPWEKMNFSRDVYRESRLKQYRNYENLSRSRDELIKECLEVEKGGTFYDFQFNTRAVKSTIIHFQLRNLLWATSKHDVYLVQNYSILHWSPLILQSREVLNVGRSVKRNGLSLSPVQISSIAVKHNLIAAGGFNGELICKRINRPEVAFCSKISSDENSITNSVDMFNTHEGSLRVIAANNDTYVRVFDADTFVLNNRFAFPWSVNATAVSPDGKLMTVLGDDADCLLADAHSGKILETLVGHLDYSFASAWHPDGRTFVTGNQDKTCRVWDVRNVSRAVSVLKGNMGAVRTVKFSADGRFLAMAEPADFVHVFDAGCGYGKCQEIDFFGEVAGMSFSPDTEALFVGVADRTYGSLLEFNRRRAYGYLDSMF